MYTSVYAYPWDVLDESPDAFCANIKEHLGVDTVSLAVSYHAAKLLLPHNPRRKLYYPEDGALYFQPDLAGFTTSAIQPHVSALAQEEDCLSALCVAAARAGLKVIAWTVCLHNTRLGERYPDFTPRTAFGDRVIHYFCPSQPAARAYVCALAGDLARRYPIQTIQLETAHHMPFVHGFHHEMQELRMTPALQVLLGLCFCPACLESARIAGVDGSRVRRYVVTEIERLFQVGGGEVELTAWRADYWSDRLDGELGRYLALRSDAVQRLLAEVHQAVQAVSSIAVYPQDQSFVIASDYQPAVDLAWLTGMKLPPDTGTADGLAVLGYFAGVERFKQEMDAYRVRIPRALPLEIGIRPAAPDCSSAEELAAKVTHCVALEAEGIAFYNYGQMPESSMHWVRSALTHVEQSNRGVRRGTPPETA
jgi:hypothetical protein